MMWPQKRWALRDYATCDGECISEQRFWTRRGAESVARWHRALCGTRGGQFRLEVERLPLAAHLSDTERAGGAR